ncbi:MAG: hypothetical protein ABIA97_03385 [Candidatus Omnitrophota bacterium]
MMKRKPPVIISIISYLTLLVLISFISPQLLFAKTYKYEIYRFEWDLDNDGHKETIRAFQEYDRCRKEPIPDPEESWKPNLTQKGWERATEILPFTKPGGGRYPTPIEVVVTIFNPVTKKTESFSLPDRLVTHGVNIAQLNDDGYYQIQLTTDKEEGGYFNYAIYGYKNGKLYKIFEKLNSRLCSSRPSHSGQTIPPSISFSKTKGCGDDSRVSRNDWEVWVWDGEKFNKTDGKSFWGRDNKGVSKVLKWSPPKK